MIKSTEVSDLNHSATGAALYVINSIHTILGVASSGSYMYVVLIIVQLHVFFFFFFFVFFFAMERNVTKCVCTLQLSHDSV